MFKSSFQHFISAINHDSHLAFGTGRVQAHQKLNTFASTLQNKCNLHLLLASELLPGITFLTFITGEMLA